MATGTLPMVWQGRSGREYVPVEGARLRHGGMASVRKVVGRGGPVGTSTVDDDVPLALKLWHEGDEASLDQLQHESRILVDLSSKKAEIPSPRLFDLVGNPLVTGLIMEWCPVDLERWWREKLHEPDAFGRLMAAMAEAARRVSDYQTFFASRREGAAHGDLKPSNILLSVDSRWLISDFGTAKVPLPEDDEWAESRILVATENFVCPEILFSARKPHPVAMDTWSLGATVFALLRMKRMVEDGAQIPSNGTHSPRFRTERINRIIEVFGHDPTRFLDRDLDPSVFADPLRIPDEDRRAVRDALQGVFGGEEHPRFEDKLCGELLEVLDHCMALEPAHRFTDARGLASAFEKLTRSYIAMAAEAAGELGSTPTLDTEEIVADRDRALRRQRALQEEVGKLNRRVVELQGRSRGSDEEEPSQAMAAADRQALIHGPPLWRPPLWWSFALVINVVLQSLILLAIVGWVAYSVI